MKIVSIIVPIYNLENKLERCLESIRKQSYTDLEVLLVDDGSSDNSYGICEEYVKKDSRYRAFRHENKGVSYTRNVGIKHASGDYLMFVDGDDYLGDNWVSDYVAAINSYHADIIIGGLTRITGGQSTSIVPPILGEPNCFWDDLCMDTTGVYGFAPNKLYNRELIINNAIMYSDNMSVQEDWRFAFSAYCCADKIACINTTEYYYEFEPNKRTINLLDIIDNQLRLLNTIKEREVKQQIITIVEKRIVSLLYSYLYHSCSGENFNEVCNKVYYIYRILDYKHLSFNVKLYSEPDFILFLHYHKRYRLIRLYFKLRHTIKQFAERRKTENESK